LEEKKRKEQEGFPPAILERPVDKGKEVILA
jgi:hypothetical protein